MTSPGRSPPRSKKESFDADEDVSAALAKALARARAATASWAEARAESALEAEPDPRRAEADAERADRQAARSAKREAKALARARRVEARERQAAANAAARLEAAAAKAADRVDTATAERESPEVLELGYLDEIEPHDEVVDDIESVDEPEPGDDVDPVEDAGPVDEADARPLRAERRAEAARLRDEATRRRQEAKQARREAKSSAKAEASARRRDRRSDADDHIVEPPRAPKASFAEKRRVAKADRARAERSRPVSGGATARPAASASGRRRFATLLAGVLGAAGLICSVILAIGALLVALDADQSSAYDIVSGICDALVGPLRDVFSFTGANAEMKQSLVAWGAGSIGYLVIGLVAQSLLRQSTDK